MSLIEADNRQEWVDENLLDKQLAVQEMFATKVGRPTSLAVF